MFLNVKKYNNLEVIWVGDSTSDNKRIKLIKKSPCYSLYNEFRNNFLKHGKPLYGAKNTIFAKSGATVKQFLDNSIEKSYFKGINDVIKYCNNKGRKEQIIIYSLGHNGGITLDNWKDIFLPQHKRIIDKLLNETNAHIILRMPNAWVNAGEKDRRELAYTKTNSLYNLYLELERVYLNRCLMVNIQDLLRWKDNEESKKFMADWTHPNEKGYRAIANVIGDSIIKVIS